MLYFSHSQATLVGSLRRIFPKDHSFQQRVPYGDNANLLKKKINYFEVRDGGLYLVSPKSGSSILVARETRGKPVFLQPDPAFSAQAAPQEALEYEIVRPDLISIIIDRKNPQIAWLELNGSRNSK